MDVNEILQCDYLTIEERCMLFSKYLREKECYVEEEASSYIRTIYDNFNDTDAKKLINVLLGSYAYIILNVDDKNIKPSDDSINSYNEILDNCIKLSLDLGLNNALEMSIMFTYLLWNGYLSKDNEFFFNVSDRLSLHGHYAFDIMNGVGVCLNNAVMLTDLLNRNNVQAATLLNKCNMNIKKDYKVEHIERNKSKESKKNLLIQLLAYPLINIISRFSGNHAYTLIRDEKRLYIYDPTNICLFNINSENKADILCGSGSTIMKPKLSTIVADYNQYKLINELHNEELFIGYKEEEFKQILEETINTCYNNLELLNGFRSQIEGSINNISNELNLIRQRKKEKN